MRTGRQDAEEGEFAKRDDVLVSDLLDDVVLLDDDEEQRGMRNDQEARGETRRDV